MLNGYSVNGAYVPAWVVRAAVVAAAAAAVVTIAPQRIVPAAAYGDANVVVTLTQTHVVAARATAAAGVDSSSVIPSVSYAGRANTTAEANGYALVYRLVPAEAGGDAEATGTALPNAKLAQASVTAESTVVTCEAHRIRPAASLQLVGASHDPIAASVTRSPLAPLVTEAAATGRAEASRKLNGESFFRHDGYVINALSVCTPTVDQDKTALIATLGSFDFGNSAGASTAFIRHPGAAVGLGQNTAGQVLASRNAIALASSSGEATATVVGTRVRRPSASATATATRVAAPALQNFKAAATATGSAEFTSVAGVRLARAQSYAESTAYQNEIFYGRRFSASGGSSAGASASVLNITLQVTALGNATVTAVATAREDVLANALGLASAIAIQANARTLTDVPAPEERQMTLPGEDRAMLVPAEDRNMMVTA